VLTSNDPIRRTLQATLAVIAMSLTMAVHTPANANTVGHNSTCFPDPEQPGDEICVSVVWDTLEDGRSVPRVEVTGGDGGFQEWCVRYDDNGPEVGPRGPSRVRCHDSYGWYSPHYDCRFRLDPAAPDEDMEGFDPDRDDGVVYEARCYPVGRGAYEADPPHWSGPPELWRGSSLFVFYGGPPDGWEATSPLADLIVEAFAGMNLRGPDIATAPPLHTAGLVHLPTWLWIEPNDETWGSASYTTDPVGGMAVRAEAEARRMVWDMGDGLDPRVCEDGSPGVAWQPGMDIGEGHGECTYRYLRPSRHEPDGTYQLTTTVEWEVTWSLSLAGGPYREIGSMIVDSWSTADYRVNEIQVLVTYR
jgi:hypothetical protein